MWSEVYDAVIVGAGFSGLSCLHELRKQGFRTRVIEAGRGIGGTWYWNCYPGARCDSEFYLYQFHQRDIPKDFEWTERFPGHAEIQTYFKYIDEQNSFSKDIQFSTRVTGATFNDSTAEWEIKTDDGVTTLARHLIVCTGFASKRYTPPFPGLEKFNGEIYHTGDWPSDQKVQFHGKHVAVIGTGASGVQIIQEIGPEVGHLTVYQRTPNLAIPMRQVLKAEGVSWNFPKPNAYEEFFEQNLKNFGALGLTFIKKKCMEQSQEEREAFYESLYAKGGFHFWLGSYHDVLFEKTANATAYTFWRQKTLARIQDPEKKELLAPAIAPHFFGTKRCCLEQSYFEVFNQPNVDIVDLRENPILEITERGIKTFQEGVTEVDIIIMATGFDLVSGGILDIDFVNGKGDTLKDKWKNGTLSYLGLNTSGFPNLFFLYGPQAPTVFANGPTVAKIQSEWLTRLLVWMRDYGKVAIEAQVEAELEWKRSVNELWNSSLFPLTESCYQGSNIPGKPVEALNYAGGIPSYIKALNICMEDGYAGFTFV